MLEIKLHFTPGITLADVRRFVEMTRDAPADKDILRYDINDELDSFGVVMDG